MRWLCDGCNRDIYSGAAAAWVRCPATPLEVALKLKVQLGL